MSVYVFTGPTLAPDEARAELAAVYLPPVSEGDISRLVPRRPQAIGIIDGYFERVPAVWHKEILWAMSQGIHLFGSASMGALRAAELAAFGMEGAGAIFEAYRDGDLEDDDEVAIAHGPQEASFRAQSEAMVNIRATLAAAEADAIVTPPTRAALERLAKDLFYPERSCALMLQRGAEAALPPAELEALRDWLPRGRIDQKRLDALQMLRVMRERLAVGLAPKRVRYHFEHTTIWERSRSQTGDLRFCADRDVEPIASDALLDELRLEGEEAYARARQGTVVRLLARDEAARRGLAASAHSLAETAESFRRERRLFEPDDVAQWIVEQDLDPAEAHRFMEDEMLVTRVQAALDPQVLERLPDYLRLTGAYARLRGRARDKQQALATAGLSNPSLADVGLTEELLLAWYFGERLRRPVPPDLARYANDSGFADVETFKRAVLRDYCYSTRR